MKILWDGRCVFAGRLPVNTDGPTGMGFTLLQIHTTAGRHVLEADIKNSSMSRKIDLMLQSGEIKYFDLFGYDEDNETEILLQDMGPDPQFPI